MSDHIQSTFKKSTSFLDEFKKFVMRGNVVDLAVGIIIGGAFGNIVSSLVNDIIMPPVGLLIGGVDFKNLFYTIKPLGQKFPSLADAQAAKAVTINWGLFVNNVIDFLIVAFVIFLLIRQINRLKSEPPPKEPTQKTCPYCATDIPIKANKCPNCTSDLNQVTKPSAADAV